PNAANRPHSSRSASSPKKPSGSGRRRQIVGVRSFCRRVSGLEAFNIVNAFSFRRRVKHRDNFLDHPDAKFAHWPLLLRLRESLLLETALHGTPHIARICPSFTRTAGQAPRHPGGGGTGRFLRRCLLKFRARPPASRRGAIVAVQRKRSSSRGLSLFHQW